VRSRTRYFGIVGTYPAGEVLTFQIARGAEELSLRATLLEGGNSPYLGIKAESLPEGKDGALVTEVVPGSPAERAGLLDKDVITLFNKKMVKTSGDLEESFKGVSVGDLIPISVLRHGAEVEVNVRVGGVPTP
jgi:S1-C subfamily serine protease